MFFCFIVIFFYSCVSFFILLYTYCTIIALHGNIFNEFFIIICIFYQMPVLRKIRLLIGKLSLINAQRRPKHPFHSVLRKNHLWHQCNFFELFLFFLALYLKKSIQRGNTYSLRLFLIQVLFFSNYFI